MIEAAAGHVGGSGPGTLAEPPRAGRTLLDRIKDPAPLAAFLVAALLCLLGVGLLTAANVNGTSIGVNAAVKGENQTLIFGRPRSIRSDEALLSTPVQVGNAVAGKPDHRWIGLTDTQLPATSLGAPVRNWTALFAPQNLGYQVLDAGRGLAFRWWSMTAFGFLGVFALLLVVRPRAWPAAVFSALVVLSPYVAWWYAAQPQMVAGCLAGAAALLILAIRSRSVPLAVLLGAAAAYPALCGAFVLYPVWIIAVALVVAAVVVGCAISIGKAGWLRLLLAGATCLALSGAVLVLFVTEYAQALAAITGTIYPGNRSVDGGAPPAAMLAAVSDLWIAVNGGSDDLAGSGFNLSEASSTWFPLPVLVAGVALSIWAWLRARRAPDPRAALVAAGGGPARGSSAVTTAGGRPARIFRPLPTQLPVLIAAAVIGLILTIWAVLPVPAALGSVLLLDKVPAGRSYIALGLVAAVLLHLTLGCADRLPRRAAIITGAIAAGVTVVLWAASAVTMLAQHGPAVLAAIALIGAVISGGFVLLWFGRVVWAGLVIVLAAVLVAYVPVNPLSVGLGPLEKSSLAREVRKITAEHGSGRWAVASGADTSNRQEAVIRANGPQVLSGLTYYPDAAVWERLAPGQQALWNNYAQYRWYSDPTADPVRLAGDEPTRRRLYVNLCSPKIDFLELRYVILRVDQVVPCLTRIGTADYGRFKLAIWERIPPVNAAP